MKERPILFSAPMVRAILAGQKTQTRRIFKAKNGGVWPNKNDLPGMRQILRNCPYGQPGDLLWVRETHAEVLLPDIPSGRPVGPRGRSGIPARPEWPSYVVYRADGEMPDVQWHHEGDKQKVWWTPSIHMPRQSSRILLEIVSVRIEKVQDISPGDAIAEGVERSVTGDGWRRYSDPETESVGLPPCQYPRHSYRSLWEHINGAASWDENPWVWVVEFKRIESPKGED